MRHQWTSKIKSRKSFTFKGTWQNIKEYFQGYLADYPGMPLQPQPSRIRKDVVASALSPPYETMPKHIFPTFFGGRPDGLIGNFHFQ